MWFVVFVVVVLCLFGSVFVVVGSEMFEWCLCVWFGVVVLFGWFERVWRFCVLVGCRCFVCVLGMFRNLGVF